MNKGETVFLHSTRLNVVTTGYCSHYNMGSLNFPYQSSLYPFYLIPCPQEAFLYVWINRLPCPLAFGWFGPVRGTKEIRSEERVQGIYSNSFLSESSLAVNYPPLPNTTAPRKWLSLTVGLISPRSGNISSFCQSGQGIIEASHGH